MYFLQQLKKAKLPARLMVQFYTAIMESILSSSITVWYAGATAKDRYRLQGVVRSAEKVIGCSLPSLHDLYVSRTVRRAGRFTADPAHPASSLFIPLLSGRRFRSIRTRTSRHKNSFFPSPQPKKKAGPTFINKFFFLSPVSDGNSIKMFMRGRPITMFIPSDVENYEDVRIELPSERLKLEWVYGYRGRDCRANVYLLPTGEIVYFIASVVVLFNYEERTQRHYLGHTDCIKCLAIHPDKIRIATGQIAGVDKDGRALQPHVRVWDSVSLSTLQVIGLGTFERGVGSLAFSKDSGQHLTVIDDCNDHMLTVWNWQKKSKIAEIKTTNEVVLSVEFHPTDPNTIVTYGKSHIFFWTWNGNSLVRKQGIFGKYEKPKFVQCLVFLRTGDILTGDSGGVLLVWTRSSITHQVKGHEGSVFCMCEMRSGTLLTGGGKDRKIILWDHELRADREIEVPDQYGAIRALSEGKGEEFLVGTSRNFILRGTFNDGFLVEVQGHTDELWGLATHPSKQLFLTCAQDQLVCLWNSTDHTLQWSRALDVSLRELLTRIGSRWH
uniref:EMAP like 4 n=1 Tax=Kryptolebias marmoratus TaxID=37003 RepID=A0A3Q3B7R3_KRYMA